MHTWIKLYMHQKHAHLPFSRPYARHVLAHLEPGPPGGWSLFHLELLCTLHGTVDYITNPGDYGKSIVGD